MYFQPLPFLVLSGLASALIPQNSNDLTVLILSDFLLFLAMWFLVLASDLENLSLRNLSPQLKMFTTQESSLM